MAYTIWCVRPPQFSHPIEQRELLAAPQIDEQASVAHCSHVFGLKLICWKWNKFKTFENTCVLWNTKKYTYKYVLGIGRVNGWRFSSGGIMMTTWNASTFAKKIRARVFAPFAEHSKILAEMLYHIWLHMGWIVLLYIWL